MFWKKPFNAPIRLFETGLLTSYYKTASNIGFANCFVAKYEFPPYLYAQQLKYCGLSVHSFGCISGLTQRRTILFEKLTVAQTVKTFPAFTLLEDSLQCLRDSAI
jgi:hypothetical protein